MSGLKRRLEAVEESVRAETAGRFSDEDEEKRWWMARARVARSEDRGDWHAADTIRLLRMQGRLGTTTEDLRARLLGWRPALDEGAVERELARTIHLREPGTEKMACPPEWAEAFGAADELRELYAAVPDEVLARWVVERWEVEQRGEDGAGQEAEGHWITNALLWRVVGPDADELPDEERQRRLRETLADVYYGERGYEIQKQIERMAAGHGPL